MSPRTLGPLAALLVALVVGSVAAADTLPNGVRLADPWPPRLAALPDALSTPPYLTPPHTCDGKLYTIEQCAQREGFEKVVHDGQFFEFGLIT